MMAKVTKVERFTLHVPFVERICREMERAGIHRWSELEITRVYLRVLRQVLPS